MKTKFRFAIRALHFALGLAVLSTLGYQRPALAQDTTITYQGRLTSGANAANGTYGLTFALFNTNTGGGAIAGPVTNNSVTVSNGLFTVLLDFGPAVFTGATNWVQLGVATNGVTVFTPLNPRQRLTPAPEAIYSESAANLSGTLAAAQLTSAGNNHGGSGNFFVGPSGNATTSGSENTANGYGALASNTSGTYNTANGYGALATNTSGFYNTANGGAALASNTGGSENTADGVAALFFNTDGSFNTANGYQALAYNTNGSYNTADGVNALESNTTGSQNTASGVNALESNTTGNNNIALGYGAGDNINTGSSNIDIGNAGSPADTGIIRIGSGQSQTFFAGVITGNGAGLTNLNISAAQLTSIGNTNGGSGNFFVGPSGNATNSGSYNTANGVSALESNTSGSQNTASGSYALDSNTSGSNNIALGFGAGDNINTGSSNIDIGNAGSPADTNIIRIGSGQSQTFLAGVITGNGAGLTNLNTSAAQLISIGNTNGGFGNFFVGPSGNATNSGSYNTAYGFEAFQHNTTGSGNTANGYDALSFNTSGSDNTANGAGALIYNTSGSDNTANGVQALISNTTGSENTANGYDTLFFNTNGSYNTANGFQALYSNTSGSENTANGSAALYSNTSGSENMADGYGALGFNTGGSENTASGFQALEYNTNGSANTADGYGALGNNTTGSNNIALGYEAGQNLTTGSSNIDIGNAGIFTDNNIIRIGSGQTSTYIAGAIQSPVFGGMVGIGTNNPQAQLHVASSGGGAFPQAQLDQQNTSDYARLRFTVGGNANQRWDVAATATNFVIYSATFGENLIYLDHTGLTVNGAFVSSSDRNVKAGFEPVDAQAVLARVAVIPITRWHYTNDPATPHLGPMAQDFHAAFDVGVDDKHIATVDEEGVALAAIQGLNQKLEEKNTEIRELKQSVAELKEMVKSLAQKN